MPALGQRDPSSTMWNREQGTRQLICECYSSNWAVVDYGELGGSGQCVALLAPLRVAQSPPWHVMLWSLAVQCTGARGVSLVWVCPL